MAEKLPSPPLSPLLGQPLERNNNINSMDGSPVVKSNNGPAESEVRRKVTAERRCYQPFSRSITKPTFTGACYPQRTPTEKAYYIAKELLMTERTYKKDLEVIDLVRRTWTPIPCYQITDLRCSPRFPVVPR